MKTFNRATPVHRDAAMNATMNAIAQTEYGDPDVLRYEAVKKPQPQVNEVLVRIHAASVNAGDWHLMRGTPFLIRLIFGGLRKPAINILGMDMAGRVEAVGSAVTQVQIGDDVFADLSASGFGAFAEYVCVPESALVIKPENTTFEQAATLPAASVAALQGLRDVGRIQPGQAVLINGASGGVGSFAVQIAKALDTTVTAVCSRPKMDMVRSLGADHVIDYTQTDITQQGAHYDLILDAAAYRPFWDYLPALTAEGTYVMVGGATAAFFQTTLLGSWVSRFSQRRVKFLASQPNPDDLMMVKSWVEAGKIIPFIDRCYALKEVPTAIRYMEQRQVRGKVAIQI